MNAINATTEIDHLGSEDGKCYIFEMVRRAVLCSIPHTYSQRRPATSRVPQNNTYRILGKCLLISSLPGKALKTLVDIARLAEGFNMRSQSRVR